MKKYILLSMFLLSACATNKTNSNVVTILSYEKYTDIYVNDELVGINHTQVQLPYKNIKNTKIHGKKRGCKTTQSKQSDRRKCKSRGLGKLRERRKLRRNACIFER